MVVIGIGGWHWSQQSPATDHHSTYISIELKTPTLPSISNGTIHRFKRYSIMRRTNAIHRNSLSACLMTNGRVRVPTKFIIVVVMIIIITIGAAMHVWQPMLQSYKAMAYASLTAAIMVLHIMKFHIAYVVRRPMIMVLRASYVAIVVFSTASMTISHDLYLHYSVFVIRVSILSNRIWLYFRWWW